MLDRLLKIAHKRQNSELTENGVLSSVAGGSPR